jgi:hypothetical protein
MVTPVTTPVAVMTAVALAPVPEPPKTKLAVVYPLPGFVMVMSVMAPFAPTVALAVAPVPSPVIVTDAFWTVNGLFVQFGLGPKACGTFDSSTGVIGIAAPAWAGELTPVANAGLVFPSMMDIAIRKVSDKFRIFRVVMVSPHFARCAEYSYNLEFDRKPYKTLKKS